MNLKKWTMLTVLVLAQVAAVLPAGAQEAQVTESSLEQTADISDSVTSDNQNTNEDQAEQPADSAVDAVEQTDATTPVTPPVDTDNQISVPGTDVTDQVYTPGTTGTVGAPQNLILYMNSARIVQDGIEYTATKPMMVKDGVSYVAIRSLVDRVGLQFYYDAATKETVIRQGSDELRFKTDSNVYTVNGVQKTMKGPSFQQDNVFMVPLTSITQALNIPYTVDAVNKTVTLNLIALPTASFKVTPSEIYAEQTQVAYTTQSSSPRGYAIINERWEGRQDVFQEPGTYVVTYAVQDAAGQWSEPYSVTITVKPPNQPPVAMFTTDKKEYKMGEKITITDLSTDDENAITKREWKNNKLAFFEPGEVTITLTVTDKHGLTGTYETSIRITDEELYNEDDFNKFFTPYGDKYTFNGSEVPMMNSVPLTSTSQPRMLIRANSPERVFQDGIVYQEVGVGSQRILVHHVNETGRNVKMYVIATNNNIVPAYMNIENSGFAGPSPFATAAGKVSIRKYFESMQTGNKRSSLVLNPGESHIILQDLNALPIKPDQVISLLSDLYTDQPIQYRVVVVEESADPIEALNYLPMLAKDGIHNRGTYMNADRTYEYTDVVGTTEQRIAIGDNNLDPNLSGYDGMDGSSTSNAGNFGVVYKIKLDRVAPYSLITFNPRGGQYSGFAMVNNQITGLPTNGAVEAPHENTVLYRTGVIEEAVEIYFTAAAGSNLPVNLLIMPLPERKH